MGREFLNMLTVNSIKSVPTTVKNPQSNVMCERMHQTVANALGCVMRTKETTPQQQAKQIMDNALATVIHATRCAVNNTMKTSPGALTFCRDMFVNVPIMVDLIAIRNNRQQLMLCFFLLDSFVLVALTLHAVWHNNCTIYTGTAIIKVLLSNITFK